MVHTCDGHVRRWMCLSMVMPLTLILSLTCFTFSAGSTRTANNCMTETRITITNETDELLPGSNAPYGVRAVGEASQVEAVSILSEIQAMLGCKVEKASGGMMTVICTIHDTV